MMMRQVTISFGGIFIVAMLLLLVVVEGIHVPDVLFEEDNGYKRKQFILFGDSITEQAVDNFGFQSLLQKSFNRKADILNRGFSGYNTFDALKVWPYVISEFKAPSLVTIFFGANDAAIPSKSPDKHVPVKNYRENLKTMIEMIKQAWPASGILLITPPPIDSARRWGERSNIIARVYATACATVGKNMDIPVLHTWDLMMEEEDQKWKSFLSDGLHFSDAGNEKFHELLLDAINNNFPKLSQNHLKAQFS